MCSKIEDTPPSLVPETVLPRTDFRVASRSGLEVGIACSFFPKDFTLSTKAAIDMHGHAYLQCKLWPSTSWMYVASRPGDCLGLTRTGRYGHAEVCMSNVLGSRLVGATRTHCEVATMLGPFTNHQPQVFDVLQQTLGAAPVAHAPLRVVGFWPCASQEPGKTLNLLSSFGALTLPKDDELEV